MGDELLPAIGDLRDRTFEKLERLGAASPPSPSPKRPKRALYNPVSPQVHMIISPWVEDEYGILTREIFADPSNPPWHP